MFGFFAVHQLGQHQQMSHPLSILLWVVVAVVVLKLAAAAVLVDFELVLD
jgi:hypothetical protein